MTFDIEGFTPLGVLGQGGFGTVHRAADDAHGREVAVKVLGRITDDSARRRFDRERRAMGTLSGHPTIGIVYTSGFTADHEPYIVMEMIRGGSLADRLENDGPLPPADVVELGITLAEALQHAHDGGVLHLDLKPENILMSRFGKPKIVDFGIAAIVDDESATSTIRATPAFADPRVLDGHPGTEQSDVYGLAATLFTLLDGSPPYSDGPSGLYRVMQRVALDPVPRVSRTDVSPRLAALLHTAMSKESSDRPASMDEFGRLLREVEAEPVTERRASQRYVDRSPTPASTPIPESAADPARSPADVPGGASDGWPGDGERPRLPGAVDDSNPVARPTPLIVPVQPAAFSSRTPTPVEPVVRPPSVAGPVATGSLRRDDPGDRDRRRGVVVAAVSSVAVVLAAVVAIAVVRSGQDPAAASPDRTVAGPSSEPVPTVDLEALVTTGGIVPDVVGLRTSDAREVIGDSGFDVQIEAHCFDTVDSQTPPAGSEVDEESIVSLQFAPCVVPDFVGLRLPEARRIVDEDVVFGLFIRWPPNCDDLVLAQSIPGGTVVDPGTEVELSLEDECGTE